MVLKFSKSYTFSIYSLKLFEKSHFSYSFIILSLSFILIIYPTHLSLSYSFIQQHFHNFFTYLSIYPFIHLSLSIYPFILIIYPVNFSILQFFYNFFTYLSKKLIQKIYPKNLSIFPFLFFTTFLQHLGKIGKIGKLENWKNWKIGKLENWKIGKLENWKIGKLENWKIGKLEKPENFIFSYYI